MRTIKLSGLFSLDFIWFILDASRMFFNITGIWEWAYRGL